MNCQQTGVHTIKAGDSLFKIAQMHQMTVPQLFELNPGIDPYNLQIGAQIVICRDNEMAHEQNMIPETSAPAAAGTAKQPLGESGQPESSMQPGAGMNAGTNGVEGSNGQNNGMGAGGQMPDFTNNIQPATANGMAPGGMSEPQMNSDTGLQNNGAMNGGIPSGMNGTASVESNTMTPPISGGMPPAMSGETAANTVSGENQAVCFDVSGLLPLNNQMRKVWAQHVYWFTMLLNSIAANTQDQAAVSARMMRNPDDIAAIFAGYYPADLVNKLRDLLRDHVRIGMSVITVWNSGDRKQANRLNQSWFQNANQIATALGRMNPYYRTDQLRNMMSRHLQMTARQAAERLAGNYEADIAALGQVENQAMDMADYLTSGLARQFTNTIR